MRFGLKWESVSGYSDAALNLLFPPVCESCETERARAKDGYICAGCAASPRLVKRICAPFCQKCGLTFEGEIDQEFICSNCADLNLHFDFARAAVVATPDMLQLFHRFKYERRIWIAPFLVNLIHEAMRQATEFSTGWDGIVPVPLHPLKKREREFNQAEELALRLSKLIQIPVNGKVLRRVEYTQTQTQLSRKQRATNMEEAFALGKTADLRGKRFLILDDILTTGATTSACAKILRKAGCARVGVWTVARGV